MKRYARIVSGLVDSISFEDPKGDPGWVQCPDTVFAGWSYDGADFTAPPPPPPPTQAEIDAEKDQRISSNLVNDPFFKAFAKTLLDEINRSRVADGQAGLTIAEFRDLVKANM